MFIVYTLSLYTIGKCPFVLDLIVSQYPKESFFLKWHNLQEFYIGVVQCLIIIPLQNESHFKYAMIHLVGVLLN